MDLGTIFGIVGALVMILLGQTLEGGNPMQLLQLTAAMIVFGGTFGAAVTGFPLPMVKFSFVMFLKVFIRRDNPPTAIIDKLVELSAKARKEGIVALEQEVLAIEDKFMRKALTMAVDGSDAKDIKNAMETEMHFTTEHEEVAPKFWEGAGGYSPTVGIIGAVIGLIQVMQNLTDIEEVGKGIAVAFVATIYGVGSANLIFLPCANKIKILNQAEGAKREMILEGVALIVEGVNPMIIRDRLASYLVDHKPEKPKEEEKKEEKK